MTNIKIIEEMQKAEELLLSSGISAYEDTDYDDSVIWTFDTKTNRRIIRFQENGDISFVKKGKKTISYSGHFNVNNPSFGITISSPDNLFSFSDDDIEFFYTGHTIIKRYKGIEISESLTDGLKKVRIDLRKKSGKTKGMIRLDILDDTYTKMAYYDRKGKKNKVDAVCSSYISQYIFPLSYDTLTEDILAVDKALDDTLKSISEELKFFPGMQERVNAYVGLQEDIKTDSKAKTYKRTIF